MKNSDTTGLTLAKWETSFRAAARADKCKVLKAHLRSLDLPDDPRLLLDGTVLFVRMAVAYLTLDNQKVIEFIEQQRYDPASVGNAPYTVTFDVFGKAYARINLPASLKPIDLADLYSAPWDDYRVVGYCDIWIARTDGVALSAEEMTAFEQVVTADLRYDYGEEELDFWFDPDTHEGILKVTVQDVYEHEGDDADDEQAAAEEDFFQDVPKEVPGAGFKVQPGKTPVKKTSGKAS
jgi:hypothetical protein